jgi:site-specific DNA-methyltransferase (adenine-specific)
MAKKKARKNLTQSIYNENINIKNQDCFIGLSNIPIKSIDIIITDPPYFIEGMDDNWDKEILSGKRFNKTTISSLPGGMKFDKNQSYKFMEFSKKLGDFYFKILKPGGFLLSFSQSRLYHSMTWGFEESGFEIRDMLAWAYEGQAKAFSQDHFIKKMNISEKEKEKLIQELGGRKTPQLKPMMENICLCQKPKEGTYVENWLKYGVGLIDTTNIWEEKFPGNIIKCAKPTKKEKLLINDHLTVKPLELMKHLIKVFTKPEDLILDPFLGSGTTALAALQTDRKIIGFEKNINYFNIIKERIKEYV